jgi:hypothetical protein
MGCIERAKIDKTIFLDLGIRNIDISINSHMDPESI